MTTTQGADGTKAADGQQSNIPDGNSDKPQTVKFETYDKAMSSLAKEKQARLELEKQLNDIKEKEMLEQGKFKELLEQKDAELKELKQREITERAQKIEANVRAKVTEVAIKLGAFDGEDVLKNISVKDLGVDSDGRPDMKLVEQKVEEIKSKKAYLFKQSAMRVADGNPQMKPQVKTGGNTIDDLKQQYMEAAMKTK